MYKKYYQNFLSQNLGVQHYAAHSHHYWPDVTREAIIQHWDDSARLVDDKWSYFFENKIPQTQRLIADILKISHPEQIVFAPNTHELLFRLISCLDFRKNIKVLTTDSEFYSFDRQVNRLQELDNFEVDKVKTQDFKSLSERFAEKIKSQHYDLIFLSQIFFNSGVQVQNLQHLVSLSSPDTIFVVDGYHAFMAVPTDLSQIENKIFYMAGAYKYAQGGEGCCFMTVPKGCLLRPFNTGWFAGYSELSKTGGKLVYSDDAMRFAGSTLDFTALYRLCAVLNLFKNEKLSVEDIHAHIQKKQQNFLQAIKELSHSVLRVENILQNGFENHGHFFAFETGNAKTTQDLHKQLLANKIVTDYRDTRLRFGFGLYQDDRIELKL